MTASLSLTKRLLLRFPLTSPDASEPQKADFK